MAEGMATEGQGSLQLKTSEQVAEQLGIPYRSLMRWVADGLIHPHVLGKGNAARLWSERHIREAKVVAELREAGVSMQRVKTAAEYLQSRGHNPFSTGRFLVLNNGGEILKVCDGGEVLHLVQNQGQQMLMVIGLGEDGE